MNKEDIQKLIIEFKKIAKKKFIEGSYKGVGAIGLTFESELKKKIDKYGVAIYINPIKVSENSFQRIRNFIKKYNYDFNIINLFDGAIVESIDEEKEKIKKLIKL